MHDDKSEMFGCEECWPRSAEAAWEATRKLSFEAELIDESHFHVVIRSCSLCSQRFISVFTETIDWADGEDPQSWTVLPITPREASELKGHGGSLTEDAINSLPYTRRSLRRDFPKNEAPRAAWSSGLLVDAHD